jgi:hypothetical protein
MKTEEITNQSTNQNQVPVKKETKKALEPKKTEVNKKEKVVKKIKKQAEVNLVEEVISRKEVKYIYPEDCKDVLSRKKFRQQVRNKLHQLELQMYRIQDKQSTEFKKKEKEYLSFRKKNVKEGAIA